jgi:hypothetical protein
MSPLTAIFDCRTSVDLLPSGIFSWKQNFEISADGKLRQAHGFGRPYQFPLLQQQNCAYKNWDFHDQGSGFNGADIAKREPVTMFFASTDNEGVRRLFLGTKTRFMRLNESTGIWDTIGSGFGADGSPNKTQVRFNGAELQNKVFLTNGYGSVLCHYLADPHFTALTGLQTAAEDGGPVTDVARVISWNGVILLLNIKESGVRFASRIRWSGLNDGTDWGDTILFPSSISDYQDLDYGERILNAVPCQGFLYVFTDRSIWRCNFTFDPGIAANLLVSPPTVGVPPSAVLNCFKIYTEPKNKSKCLAYPNTLVSTGNKMYYMGRDAIYEFDPYMVEPVRTDWIYPSSAVIYDALPTQIDANAVQSPVGEYWPDTKELHFSWPVVEVIQVAGSQECNAPTGALNSGLNRHTLVCNTQYQTCDYRDYGSNALVNFIQDIAGQDPDNMVSVFLGANGADYCIKQFGLNYAREIYAPATDTFSLTGYSPILRGIFPFGQFNKRKLIKMFLIDAAPEVNAGTVFQLSIGVSGEALDPNRTVAGCGVVWHKLSNKVIGCQEDMTPEQYAAFGIYPNKALRWTFLYQGKFLYYQITIANPDDSPATAGGASISRFEVKALEK